MTLFIAARIVALPAFPNGFPYSRRDICLRFFLTQCRDFRVLRYGSVFLLRVCFVSWYATEKHPAPLPGYVCGARVSFLCFLPCTPLGLRARLLALLLRCAAFCCFILPCVFFSALLLPVCIRFLSYCASMALFMPKSSGSVFMQRSLREKTVVFRLRSFHPPAATEVYCFVVAFTRRSLQEKGIVFHLPSFPPSGYNSVFLWPRLRSTVSLPPKFLHQFVRLFLICSLIILHFPAVFSFDRKRFPALSPSLRLFF